MTARIQQTLALNTEVQNVRFAHGKRLDGLHDLGIHTIRDLLEHYPFRYDDFSKISPIIDLKIGEKRAVLGTIFEAKGRKLAKGGFLFEISLIDETGTLKAVWFNQRWLQDILTPGKQVLLLGSPQHYAGFMSMSAPLYTLVNTKETASAQTNFNEHIEATDEGVNPVGIVPVYSANSKVSSNWIKRLVLESRSLVSEPLDPLPARLRMKRRLVSKQTAWHDIHTPKTEEERIIAHNRLAYEQVFMQQFRFLYSEGQRLKGYSAYEHTQHSAQLDALRAALPYELTESQEVALSEILEDMQAAKRMNRLLLGDVGSGKTVVALFALVAAIQSTHQAAMMAPTEVLSQQYAKSIGEYLTALNIPWALLTSSTNAKDRTNILEQLKQHKLSVLFGTHALIEPEVEFADLSLIVVDEQHRFGVEQRKALIAKSPSADYLSMTATPIPRSLALVRYGAIGVSLLKSRPGKAKTITHTIDSSVSYKAYEAVRKALGRGEQAYIVCPLISVPKSEEEEYPSYLDALDDFEDSPSIAAAEAELEHLRLQVLPGKKIELLTSRVSAEKKKRIMQDFKEGLIDVLVSTTVIEVGIDVPNATVMLILDADRFGLAQLHQLRGRIGRGTKDSQVFLIAHNPSEAAERRLKLMQTHSDGLKLAEADLLARREGDLAGTRQHGQSSLKLVNAIRDKKLIEAATTDAETLLTQDPDLIQPEHQHIKYELERCQETSLD